MNINRLWMIIILMTLAMLGSIGTQIYWINGAIRENEKRFKGQVYDALNNVAERLVADEQADIDNMRELTESIKEQHKYKIDLSSGILGESSVQNRRLSNSLKAEKMLNQRQLNTDLGDRVKPQDLATYIDAELSNFGIDLNYQHVVYDKKLNSIIIKNGIYVAPNDNPLASPAAIQELSKAKYQVNLFTNTFGAAGVLILTFTNEATQFWKRIWRIVAVSILFTILILFCFFYSINIIYRQKKLGEMKTDFINNMTHEFKTPIATISLASDSIKSPKVIEDPSRITRFANIIKEENKRMLSQVEKVLQMALLDKEDYQLKRSELDMHDIIHRAIDNTNLQVIKRGGMVTADLRATNPIIEGDVTHISNIIHNLLDNANKYSPDQPIISVSTDDVKDGLRVVISDRGLGLSKEAQKHIFDKFYRVHTGNRHDVKGFGLGLSYVKAMMAAHNADVSVKSELGKGSDFILSFPRKYKVDKK